MSEVILNEKYRGAQIVAIQSEDGMVEINMKSRDFNITDRVLLKEMIKQFSYDMVDDYHSGARQQKIFVKKIKEVVSKHKINTASQRKEHIYKRHYIVNYLRFKAPKKTRQLTYVQIGGIIGRNYSTAFNSLKEHDNLMKYNKKEYLEVLGSLVEEIAAIHAEFSH